MSKLYNGKMFISTKPMNEFSFVKAGRRAKLKNGSFPDHSGDGKITQKDVLMAKGVIPKPKKKNKKMMAKKKSPRMKAMGIA